MLMSLTLSKANITLRIIGNFVMILMSNHRLIGAIDMMKNNSFKMVKQGIMS